MQENRLDLSVNGAFLKGTCRKICKIKWFIMYLTQAKQKHFFKWNR